MTYSGQHVKPFGALTVSSVDQRDLTVHRPSAYSCLSGLENDTTIVLSSLLPVQSVSGSENLLLLTAAPLNSHERKVPPIQLPERSTFEGTHTLAR